MLTFKDLDQHAGLVVCIGREDFRLLGRDGGVARDERRRDSTSGLKYREKGSDIEKKVLGLLGGVAPLKVAAWTVAPG